MVQCSHYFFLSNPQSVNLLPCNEGVCMISNKLLTELLEYIRKPGDFSTFYSLSDHQIWMKSGLQLKTKKNKYIFNKIHSDWNFKTLFSFTDLFLQENLSLRNVSKEQLNGDAQLCHMLLESIGRVLRGFPWALHQVLVGLRVVQLDCFDTPLVVVKSCPLTITGLFRKCAFQHQFVSLQYGNFSSD